MSRAQRGREEPEAKALDAEQGGDSLSAAGSPPGPGAGKPGEQPLPQTLQVAVAPACASYGRSHLTRPLSCVTQPVSGGGGCPASPSLHLKGARAQPHCQGPDGGRGAGPLQAPGLICGQHGQTAGENGQPRSPGACDSPARCADRRLPSEGTSRCHHPPSDPSASSRGLGGWQAARIHPEGKRLSEEKKNKNRSPAPTAADNENLKERGGGSGQCWLRGVR